MASEPYGVVEETARRSGWWARASGRPRTRASRQILRLDASHAGESGAASPMTGHWSFRVDIDAVTAEVTTREPSTVATLRTSCSRRSARRRRASARPFKIIEQTGLRKVFLGGTYPGDPERLTSGTLRRILVIGQGTAAVAGQAGWRRARRTRRR
ncbi:MAG: hypothetical protein R2715_24995 [Ilumatobacteraceae bacterium]